MKIVVIHGRVSYGQEAEEIKSQWISGLQRGFRNAGIESEPPTEIELPLYGNRLEELTQSSVEFSASAVTRGEPPEDSVDPVVKAVILAMAHRAGWDQNTINQIAGNESSENGMHRWEQIQLLACKLENDHPWLSQYVLEKLIQDIKAYLDFPHIQFAVHNIIEPAIGTDGCIVIAHSLGSIIAYRVLVERCLDTDIPLFITAGSPLGLDLLKTRIAKQYESPTNIRRWINLSDPRDVVAVTPTLDENDYLPWLENLPDINNGPDDPHSIESYLSDPRVGQAIHDTLRI